MRSLSRFALLAAFAAPGLLSAAPGFRTETLAPGVHAFVRTKPLGMLLDANVLVIVNDEDVVVVDANLTPTSAEATIAAIRALSPKPVSLLVNTHRHADHTGGNATYRGAFPEVEILASAEMAEDLAAKGDETMQGWIGWARQLSNDLPKALAAKTSLGGKPLTEPLRVSYEGDLAAVREIVADAGHMAVAGPSATIPVIGGKLTLRRTIQGKPRTIEIFSPGRGHTRGDLVVWLPAERVLAAGDLLVTPGPLVGADQSYVEDWIGTLDRLAGLEPAFVVPGHGAVARAADAVGALRAYRDFFAAVVTQASPALAAGKSADVILETLDVESFRKTMAGDDPVANFLFTIWGRNPSVQAMERARQETPR
jgi:glyoxylase-like metal-dependent hydrolase (beta-lactamase superfamily II)